MTIRRDNTIQSRPGDGDLGQEDVIAISADRPLTFPRIAPLVVFSYLGGTKARPTTKQLHPQKHLACCPVEKGMYGVQSTIPTNKWA